LLINLILNDEIVKKNINFQNLQKQKKITIKEHRLNLIDKI
jgi:hypothetical protein